MEELDISASRRVRGLGAKQRELLLDKFAKKARADRPATPRAAGSSSSPAPRGSARERVVRAARCDAIPTARTLGLASRPGPRPGEGDGVDYFFVDDEGFDRMIGEGELLEWAEIFGHRSGTPARPSSVLATAGRDVVLEIDVQGAGRSASRCPTRS